jgi:Ca2+-binding EF-hand superfamily protein
VQHAVITKSIDRLLEGLTSKSAAREAFADFDLDHSGSLDAREFGRAARKAGIHINDAQLAGMVKFLDRDGDGTIDIEEFISEVWSRKFAKLRSKFKACSYSLGGQDWEKLFRHYDRDNSGELDFDEFRRAVRRDVKVTPQMMPDIELREMFDHADASGDGAIDIDEFVGLLGDDQPLYDVPADEGADRRRSKQRMAVFLHHNGQVIQNEAALRQGFDGPFKSTGVRMGIINNLRTNSLESHLALESALDAALAHASRLLDLPLKARCFCTTEGKEIKSINELKPNMDLVVVPFKGRFSKPKKPVASPGSARSSRVSPPSAGGSNARATPGLHLRTAHSVAERAERAQQKLFSQAAATMFERLHSKDDARRVFHEFDKDESGSLDASELAEVAKTLGVTLSDAQLEGMVKLLDRDGDGLIDIEEFISEVWSRKFAKLRSKFKACSYSLGGQDWEKLFRHYDRDNSGELDFDEFRRAVRRDVKVTPQMMPDIELREMFDHADASGDGAIDIDEFVGLLRADSTSMPRASASEEAAACVPPPAPSEGIPPSGDKKAAQRSTLSRRQDNGEATPAGKPTEGVRNDGNVGDKDEEKQKEEEEEEEEEEEQGGPGGSIADASISSGSDEGSSTDDDY